MVEHCLPRRGEWWGRKKKKPRNSDLIFPSSLESIIPVFHHSIIPIVSEANYVPS